MQRENAIAVVYELAETVTSTMEVVFGARHQVAQLIDRDAILAGEVSFDADWRRGTFSISATRPALLEGLPLIIGDFSRSPLPN